MQRIFGVICLLVPLAIACSDRALNRTHATQLIAGLDGFKTLAFFSFTTERGFTEGTIAFDCMTQAIAERQPVSILLLKLGWVRFENRPTVVGLDKRVHCPALVLTEKGRAASTGWSSRADITPGSTSWSVPIGERKLLEITGLTETPYGVTVAEFNWKWMPNSMGKALIASADHTGKFFEQVRKGAASCRRWDDGWRCKIDRMGKGFEDFGTLSVP